MDLLPGIDYVVKAEGGVDWVAFDDVGGTKDIRNTWILRRRRRPVAPTFWGSPLPRRGRSTADRNACIIMTYFHPWTLQESRHDDHIPYAGALRKDSETWEGALRVWLDGNILCEESKRYIGNFMSVYRVRPGNDDDDAASENSADMLSDEDLEVTKDMLADVLSTRIGGRQPGEESDTGEGDEHHQNSSAAIELGKDVWCKADRVLQAPKQKGYTFDDSEVQKSLAAARKSRSKEESLAARSRGELREERDAKLISRKQATQEDVKEWLAELKIRKRTDGRSFVNQMQFEAITRVAEQVILELPTRDGRFPKPVEPLRWVVHGGPGTGKSHVVKDVIKEELFDQILKWQQGLDYQTVALQAVMANLLDGDTIHHACGIPVRKKGKDGDIVIQQQKEVAERFLYWKWLLVDEFGMVGCDLLAEVDMKLRDLIVDVRCGKKSHRDEVRPFGGLNVLLCGDLWQLPPPSGGFLGSIPAEWIRNARKYIPRPTQSHGQSLLWAGPKQKHWAFHGVTELEESERCREDPWLQEVQVEMRNGSLSEDNHAFLHGQQTTVCGSSIGGKPTCERSGCTRDDEYWDRTAGRYALCDYCREQRKSRSLVASDGDDPRFKYPKFVDAPAIFPNNDIKYDVNKRRAELYASNHGYGITWVFARDKPQQRTLRERPGISLQKSVWLCRHDRECGDLYGIIPLIPGLAVALTEHVDRSPEKHLLKGKVGKIHSWREAATESSVWEDGVRILNELPDVVYVKYEGCKWHIEGTPEPGIYPIVPKKKSWFLDKGRMYPQLEIKRHQLPLAPAFAWTAHTAQGQTLPAAIVDLSRSAMSSYVAFTRVKRKEDLLIYRAFDRDIFNGGPLEGPELLLSVLRGEEIDWAAIEEKHMPRHMCTGCETMNFKTDYSEAQWKRSDGRRFCKICEKALSRDGERKECYGNCKQWYGCEEYDVEQWGKRSGMPRFCNNCSETRRCRGKCRKWLTKGQFTDAEWKYALKHASTRGRCTQCMHRNREEKPCSLCYVKLEEVHFSPKQWRTSDGKRKCKKCMKHVEVKACTKCNENLPRAAYTSELMWKAILGKRYCWECEQFAPRKARAGHWSCKAQGCGIELPMHEFTEWLAKRVNKKKYDGTLRCNTCFLKEKKDKDLISKANVDTVMRHSQRKDV